MLKQIETMPMPDWLSALTAAAMHDDPFPLKALLKDSLYYPACGFDGDPVKYLAGNIYSFIYVDYGYGRDDFTHAITEQGFQGYDLLASKSVRRRELSRHSWRADPLVDTNGYSTPSSDTRTPFFCIWSVFQRREDFDVEHGPERFSLLYLCEEGVAAFRALYLANSIVPRAVAVIQPGHGFGGNWTDFTDPDRVLARTVLGNPMGIPELLLHGGIGDPEHYRMPIWQAYENLICFLDKSGGGRVGVWGRDVASSMRYRI